MVVLIRNLFYNRSRKLPESIDNGGAALIVNDGDFALNRGTRQSYRRGQVGSVNPRRLP